MGRKRIYSDEERVLRARASSKKYAENNPEKIKELHKKWVKEHPDKIKAMKRKWAQKNPEKVSMCHSAHTTSMGHRNCPVCGKHGQLKRRISRVGYVFYQVDHYTHEGDVLTKKYEGNCHIKNELARSLGFGDVGRGGQRA